MQPGSMLCSVLLFICLVIEQVDGDVAPTPTSNLPSLRGKACVARAKGRGVGAPLHFCPNGTERNGLLCYHPCSPGYRGDGPVCWKSCPEDTHDYGVFCFKAYGKGCCCTAFGCCRRCKAGFKESGCFCTKGEMKRSYGRGVGTRMRCGPEEEQNGGLCYKPCPVGYEGEGPVCWEEASPPGFPYKCTRVLYTVDRATCVAMGSGLIKTGSFTGACVALAMVFAVTSAGMLLPAASFFCGKSFDSIVSEVEEVVEMTQAKACSLS